MNPFFYLKVFAWIAITGFGCLMFMDYWIPILIGTAVLTFLVSWASRLTPRP